MVASGERYHRSLIPARFRAPTAVDKSGTGAQRGARHALGCGQPGEHGGAGELALGDPRPLYRLSPHSAARSARAGLPGSVHCATRIRDKIAASKKKGLWMGGLVPLGYDAKDRTLVINETEAETADR